MKLDIQIINMKSKVFDEYYDVLIIFPQRKYHHYNSKDYSIIGNNISKNAINSALFWPEGAVAGGRHLLLMKEPTVMTVFLIQK